VGSASSVERVILMAFVKKSNSLRALIWAWAFIALAIGFLTAASIGGTWSTWNYDGVTTNFGLRGASVGGVWLSYSDDQVNDTGMAVSVLLGLSLSLLGIQLIGVTFAMVKGDYRPSWWPWLETISRFVDVTAMFAWLSWVFWAHRRLVDILPYTLPDIAWCWGLCIIGGFFCFCSECHFKIYGGTPVTPAEGQPNNNDPRQGLLNQGSEGYSTIQEAGESPEGVSAGGQG